MKRVLLALFLSCALAGAQTTWIFNPHTGKLDAVSIVPSGVPGTWGTIAGTLSNQSDLQSALDLKQPIDTDLSAIAALTTTSFGRGLLDDADAAAGRLTLGSTTVGSNIFTIPSPGAIRFMRVNADSSVSLLDAPTFLASIGGSTSVWGTITGTLSNQIDLQTALDAKQPLDTDLTAIAALTTTAFGRGLLDDPDAATARTSIGVVYGTNVLTPTGDGSGLTNINFTQVVGIATDAQIPAAIARDAEVAAAFQPLDADLTALAAASATNNFYYRSAPNVWSPVTIGANLTFTGGTLAATGGGGGGTWGTITGTLSSQTDLQTALDSKQPIDADLTSLSAASATNQFYYRSAANTWAPVTIGPNLTFVGGTLSGTGAGGVAWGGISGTLSNQTDLQAVLDVKQPLDADLTAIAALTTTTFGRSLLDDANTTAAQATLGLVIGTNVLAPNGDGSGLTGFTDAQIPATIARDTEVAAGFQPLDTDLSAIAALTTAAYGRSLLTTIDNTAARASLGLVIGTDVLSPTGNGSGLTGFVDAQIPAAIARDAEVAAGYQPLDADLTSFAGISATGSFYYHSAANTWSPVTVGSGLSFTSGTLTATAGGGGTVTATAGALTNNAIMLGAGSVDTKVLGSLGTTTTVLHGNAAGAPSFAPVTFSELSGTLSSSQIPTTVDLTGKSLTSGTFISPVIVGASGPVGTPTSTYSISAQNNAAASYMEILNNGGAGKGAFFGMTGNNFELWNYQGGSTIFYTNTTASTGLARVKIDQTGILSALANFDVSNGAASSGRLDIYEDSDFGTNFARFQVPPLATNTVYTLPPDDGNSGDRLTTDGSGVLTWTAGGGSGTPGGTNTQVQFNDSGTFGGDAGLTYDKTADILSVPTIATTAVTAGALEFEGATADAFETVITAIDPTADRIVQLPNASTIIPVYGYVATYTGFTGPHTITFPDANFTAARTDAANTFVGLQQFTPSSTVAGINVGSIAGDPSAPSNGGIWYDSTGNSLRARINGANISLGSGGGGLPGGTSGMVQFNDGGVLGGITGFVFDKATGILTVPTITATAVTAGSLEFEGVTADAFETIIAAADPTADRTVTLPNADTKLPIYAQHITYAGPTAPRTVSYPDANFIVAQRDGAQNFTGQQQFTPTSTLPGINVGSIAGDPGGATNGGIWYDSTGNLLRARINGANVTLGTALGTGVATFLATPSSANLRSAVTDEVGTGPAMFTRTGVLRTVYINVGAMIPRITNGAAPGTTQSTTNGIMYDSLDFDSTTEEGAGFWWTPPSVYNAGTLTAKFHWTCAGGTGNVKWDIAARCFSDDDAIDQALGTEQTAGTDALLAVGDMHISPTTPALTVGGTAVANRPIYFQVTRDTATDTLSADARLLGVTLEYTESTTEPSAQ